MYLDDIVIEGNIVSSTTDPQKYTVHVSPNPTTGAFNVSGETINENAVSITLTSATGVIIYSSNANPSSGRFYQSISIEELPQGVYFLNVKSGDDSVYVEKVIKE